MRDPFDDFDSKFDRHFDRMDKMADHPVRSFLGLGLLALIGNILFWGTLIVIAFVVANYFGVI